MLTSSHYSLMFSITFYDLRRSICSHLNFVKSLLREEVVWCPRPRPFILLHRTGEGSR